MEELVAFQFNIANRVSPHSQSPGTGLDLQYVNNGNKSDIHTYDKKNYYPVLEKREKSLAITCDYKVGDRTSRKISVTPSARKLCCSCNLSMLDDY